MIKTPLIKWKRTQLFRIIFATLLTVLATRLIQNYNHRNETSEYKKHTTNIRNSAIGNKNLDKLQYIYRSILLWSAITDEQERDLLLNRHEFSYSFGVDHRKIPEDVVIFVQSAADHFGHRARIRGSWGRVSALHNVTFRTVFMLGQPENLTLQDRIKDEFQTNGDIVQGNFIDTYRNLPFKHVMALGWIATNCPGVKLIVKVDDDTILNIYNLIDYILEKGLKPNTLYCSVFYHQGPVRYRSDKWYVDNSTYPFEKYPDYCEGFGYLMSPDVARLLYKASERTRYYWVDDVYVTGILALKVGLRLSCFENKHTYIRSRRSGVNVKDALFIAATTRMWNLYWNEILATSSGPRSSKHLRSPSR